MINILNNVGDCECGNVLPFKPTPFQTNTRMVCSLCKKIHYYDEYDINWSKLVTKPKEATHETT